ncbi:hypothetical protein B0H11DRAFT_1933034 [Mycena galericulata]|nr:hypothetical protein B0H11DRAFT_1933034 [Mycena galericulata]
MSRRMSLFGLRVSNPAASHSLMEVDLEGKRRVTSAKKFLHRQFHFEWCIYTRYYWNPIAEDPCNGNPRSTRGWAIVVPAYVLLLILSHLNIQSQSVIPKNNRT